MRNPAAIELAAPPRLSRSVGLQALALAAMALLADHPWARKERAVPPEPPTPKEMRRIRVVQIPRPPPAPAQPARPLPSALSSAPSRSAPAPARSALAPAPARSAAAPAKARSTPKPAPVRIAADSTAVHGVRLRVLVPRSPEDLAAHLRNSGGCMVVSRLNGGEAEVLSVLRLDGSRAVELPGPPCDGVPRLLRDAGLNDALGDPLGRARAAAPGEDLVLQILLTARLPDLAQYALRARFGPIPQEEMARRAAESGYELTCFAEPAGSMRCQ
jgi:hypothetical protein